MTSRRELLSATQSVTLMTIAAKSHPMSSRNARPSAHSSMLRVLILLLSAPQVCAVAAPAAKEAAPILEVAATSPTHAWNGVAVANDGRIFASFPRWDKTTPSVAVIGPDGAQTPYPGDGWNEWKPGEDPARHFISINSLFIDRDANHLWVVDPATPHFGGIVQGGPKLVEIDLATDKVVNVYSFDLANAPANSHLNDARVLGDHVFITDSGTGALLVLDRTTGHIRRLLAKSRLTKADPSIIPHVDGHQLAGPTGKIPQLNADQIELSADRKTLFFMSPFGPNLYRVALADLLDESLSDSDLEQRVKVARHVTPVGGLVIDRNNVLYLSEVETHSIRAEAPDGHTLWTIKDRRLDWPDAYSIGPDGTFYIVAAQVDQLPGFNQGHDGRKPPYYMFRFKPKAP
ncbi:L-dopachrome tautomerase-related protein [Beijerinckia indica]|uniref:Major royal jelly protein n=1 Tax=Beijerinckia indica subsp. indica (strain ATCC 9039 / DSM 1715 / NCIMB 8712) TaxID=395963 RepID=B2ICG5_BEII9|nr:L-dopachrome tautomerase-related protein [Beijerinckia indica]ACB93854.1 conserved hypothetical protein [Beijerinckia indica subsp. indica ATCC 9039]